MRHRILFIACVVAVSFTSVGARAFHAIHISFAEMEWKGSTISGRVSFYKDDYGKAVANWAGRSAKPEELAQLRMEYLKSHFRLWTDGFAHQSAMRVVSMTEDESSYIYQFQFAAPTNAKSVTIDDRVLFAEYADETNLILLKRSGEEINHSFSKSSPTFVIHS